MIWETMERIKKIRQTSNTIDAGCEKTSWKSIDQKSGEQGQLEEIYYVLKVVVQVQE